MYFSSYYEERRDRDKVVGMGVHVMLKLPESYRIIYRSRCMRLRFQKVYGWIGPEMDSFISTGDWEFLEEGYIQLLKKNYVYKIIDIDERMGFNTMIVLAPIIDGHENLFSITVVPET